MKRKARWMAAAAAAIVALGTGTGIAVASAGDDDGADQPITGPALAEASRVARAETGGGRVVATEIRDEEDAVPFADRRNRLDIALGRE